MLFLSKVQQKKVCQSAFKLCKKVFIHGRESLVYITGKAILIISVP